MTDFVAEKVEFVSLNIKQWLQKCRYIKKLFSDDDWRCCSIVPTQLYTRMADTVLELYQDRHAWILSFTYFSWPVLRRVFVPCVAKSFCFDHQQRSLWKRGCSFACKAKILPWNPVLSEEAARMHQKPNKVFAFPLQTPFGMHGVLLARKNRELVGVHEGPQVIFTSAEDAGIVAEAWYLCTGTGSAVLSGCLPTQLQLALRIAKQGWTYNRRRWL